MPVSCELYLDCALRIGRFQLMMNTLRYLPFVAVAFLVLWVWKRDYFDRFRIQTIFPKAKILWHEGKYSFLTALVFTVQATCVAIASKLGWTQVYKDIDAMGWWYLPFSFLLLTIWHETWFYWAHRAMHHRSIFRHVHAVHHKSINPSPWAAYSFHWTEAILEAAYLTTAVFMFPLHLWVIIAHTFYAMFVNVLWHSGYEFFPKGFAGGRFTKWINTSTHHNMHHSHVHGNYSLYFNVWDRLLGTNFPTYESYYEKVVARRERPTSASHKPGHGVAIGALPPGDLVPAQRV